MIPEWLAASGPPWWAFLLALLTSPAEWSRRASTRLGEMWGSFTSTATDNLQE